MHREKEISLESWPKRLTAAPPRLEEINVSPDEFHEDSVSSWIDITCHDLIFLHHMLCPILLPLCAVNSNF